MRAVVDVLLAGRRVAQHDYSPRASCSDVKTELQQQYGPGSLSPAGDERWRLSSVDRLDSGQHYEYNIFSRAAAAGGDLPQPRFGSVVSTPEPKNIWILDPPYTYGLDRWLMTEYQLEDDSDYKAFLSSAGVLGLRKVAEDADTFYTAAEDKLHADYDQGPAVRKFDALSNGAVYAYGAMSKSALTAVRVELTHLNQRREDQFGQGLEDIVRKQEPGQDFKAYPELRTSLPHPSQPRGEVDSVIVGNSKVYIGSHKTHIDSTKPVVEVADHCQWLTQHSKDNPAALPEAVRGREFRAAVMAEKVKPSLQTPVNSVCKERSVLQLRRNGRCISQVQCHHRQRLLRM